MCVHAITDVFKHYVYRNTYFLYVCMLNEAFAPVDVLFPASPGSQEIIKESQGQACVGPLGPQGPHQATALLVSHAYNWTNHAQTVIIVLWEGGGHKNLQEEVVAT